MKNNTIIFSTFIFLLLAFLFPIQSTAGFSIFGRYKSLVAQDDEVRIPIEEVNDGAAHYFSYKTKDKNIKFFVIKSRDNVIRAAFDACDVCFRSRKGYSQDGDFVICNNCGRRFHTSQVNVVEGGCNPAPLKREIIGDHLVIKVEDILPGGRFF